MGILSVVGLMLIKKGSCARGPSVALGSQGTNILLVWSSRLTNLFFLLYFFLDVSNHSNKDVTRTTTGDYQTIIQINDTLFREKSHTTSSSAYADKSITTPSFYK